MLGIYAKRVDLVFAAEVIDGHWGPRVDGDKAKEGAEDWHFIWSARIYSRFRVRNLLRSKMG